MNKPGLKIGGQYNNPRVKSPEMNNPGISNDDKNWLNPGVNIPGDE